MNKTLSDIGLFVLRLSFSTMMLTHGLGKLDRLFADEIKFGDPIGLGPVVSLYLVVLGEFLAPMFVILGIKTRLAAFFPFFTMLVAAFLAHGADPFERKEKALLFMFGFLVIILCGSGRYALDRIWKKSF